MRSHRDASVLGPAPGSLEDGRRIVQDAHPCHLIEHNGAIVGCWHVSDAWDRPEAEGLPAQRRLDVLVHGMLRTDDGRVVGMSTLRRFGPDLEDFVRTSLESASGTNRIGPRREAARIFVGCLRRSLSEIRHRRHLRPEMVLERMPLALGGLATIQALEAARVVFCARRAILLRFLGTFDAKALRLLDRSEEPTPGRPYNGHLADLLGEAWPQLDETFGNGAPMREAVTLADAIDPRAVEPLLRSCLGRPSAWDDSQSIDMDLCEAREPTDRERRLMDTLKARQDRTRGGAPEEDNEQDDASEMPGP